MPDHHDPTLQTPIRDWSNAFAALPLESPDAGAWQRLQRFHAPRRASRGPAWFAIAAVFALAAALPWQLSRNDPPGDAHDAPAVVGDMPQVDPGRMAVAQPDAAALPDQRRIAPDTGAAATRTTKATPAAERQPRLPGADRARRGARAVRAAVAGLDSGEPAAGLGERTVELPAEEPAADAQLEPLYAESARLEALLALARDDRVASGASAALAGAYEAQVASIDAALREPALPGGAHSALWRQRVEALRQLAGFESTQRALAASGERYDAMLVSID